MRSGKAEPSSQSAYRPVVVRPVPELKDVQGKLGRPNADDLERFTRLRGFASEDVVDPLEPFAVASLQPPDQPALRGSRSSIRDDLLGEHDLAGATSRTKLSARPFVVKTVQTPGWGMVIPSTAPPGYGAPARRGRLRCLPRHRGAPRIMQRNLGPGRYCGGRAPVTDITDSARIIVPLPSCVALPPSCTLRAPVGPSRGRIRRTAMAEATARSNASLAALAVLSGSSAPPGRRRKSQAQSQRRPPAR